MVKQTMVKYGFSREYLWFDVVPYEVEGMGDCERSFKRFGNALKYANKLIEADIWCAVYGFYWSDADKETKFDQICAC